MTKSLLNINSPLNHQQDKSNVSASKTHVPFILPKLTINQPNDQYEQEADKMADNVVNIQGPDPQGTLAPTSPIQRKCTACESEEKEEIQRKEENGENTTADEGLEHYVSGLAGSGQPLPNTERNYYEPRLGYDFSNVKVHTDGEAARSAQSIKALAYTTGNNIVFNNGQYSPGTDSGKKLLAHELTHVVQQGTSIKQKRIQKRGLSDGHNLSSPRFAGNLRLEDAYDSNTGGIVIKKNDNGLEVRILQQALIDAGIPLTAHGVDGDFGDETKDAVKTFQGRQGLTGSDVDGIVGITTMQLLDTYFLNHGTMAAIPIAVTPATRLTGTRALNAAEIAEIERRRTTEVQAPPGGPLPTFHSIIPLSPDPYETRVENETNRIITLLHTRYALGKSAQRLAVGGLHSWASIEQVADVSKRETDRVFSNYASRPALRHGVNLFDAWEDKVRQYAAGGPAFEQGRVEWRVNKIFTGPQIHAIDVQHGAVQSRAAELLILTNVRNRIIAARRAQLIEIDHGWPGFADPDVGHIFIQRFTSPNATGNRNFMWEQFQTLVHEYIHTLAHADYRTYYQSLPEMRGGKTYREGMTDYFTKMVLESTVINAALRRDVEGSFHDPLIIHPIPRYGGYGEAANAEAVVGVSGIRNAMAAYFLGRTDLIGGP